VIRIVCENSSSLLLISPPTTTTMPPPPRLERTQDFHGIWALPHLQEIALEPGTGQSARIGRPQSAQMKSEESFSISSKRTSMSSPTIFSGLWWESRLAINVEPARSENTSSFAILFQSRAKSAKELVGHAFFVCLVEAKRNFDPKGETCESSPHLGVNACRTDYRRILDPRRFAWAPIRTAKPWDCWSG
jgi:hypothetical protein